MKKTSGNGGKPMTDKAAARIQGAAAKGNSGGARKGEFAGRAQRAAANNSGSSKKI